MWVQLEAESSCRVPGMPPVTAGTVGSHLALVCSVCAPPSQGIVRPALPGVCGETPLPGTCEGVCDKQDGDQRPRESVTRPRSQLKVEPKCLLGAQM